MSRWNGSQWSVLQVPLPAGATSGGLTGVSCTSATACTAVGFDYSTAAGSGPVAERWNGRRWQIQPTPSPGTEGVPFSSVSCASAASCTAVGYYDSGDIGFSSSTLVEHRDGTTWSLQHLRLPAAATALRMTAVSCPSIQRCTAVGYAATSQGQLTLAEHWSGHGWTVQTTQNPSPGLTGILVRRPWGVAG